MTRVVGIAGSLRADSTTRIAVELALTGAAELADEVELIDLGDYDLPFCDGMYDENTETPEVHRLREAVASAGGIVLGTPEYHGSFSGVLKNALDLMSDDEFGGKMVGLIAVAGGRLGATNALNGLRTVGRALHSWVLPHQVSIAQGSSVLRHPESDAFAEARDRLQELGRQVARFAYLHNSDAAQEFVQAWESAIRDD